MLVELHLDILNRLKPIAEGTGVQLRLMPQSPDAYIRAVRHPQMILMLPDSDFGEPQTQGRIVQPWLLNWTLEFRLPENWTTEGALVLMQGAINRLIGYKPPQLRKPLIMRRTMLDGEYRDLWVYRLLFRGEAKAFEPGEEPDSEIAIIEQIKLLRHADGSEWFTVTDPPPETLTLPNSPQVMRDGDAVVVSWTAPDECGFELLGYTVQVEIDGQWQQTKVVKASLTAQRYEDAATVTAARIRAMWDDGYSDWITVAV